MAMGRSFRRGLFIVSPLLLIAGTAHADQASLLPPASTVELRSYGFGLLPLDGKFTRFHGWIRYDAANPGACQVVLEMEAASLAMANDSIRERITGPEMMDVARFPTLAFHGACQGETVAGTLTMHGQTHPFSMDFVRSGGMITATGRLRRADWGITGSPLVGGSTVRIQMTIPDPISGIRI